MLCARLGTGETEVDETGMACLPKSTVQQGGTLCISSLLEFLSMDVTYFCNLICYELKQYNRMLNKSNNQQALLKNVNLDFQGQANSYSWAMIFKVFLVRLEIDQFSMVFPKVT